MDNAEFKTIKNNIAELWLLITLIFTYANLMAAQTTASALRGSARMTTSAAQLSTLQNVTTTKATMFEEERIAIYTVVGLVVAAIIGASPLSCQVD